MTHATGPAEAGVGAKVALLLPRRGTVVTSYAGHRRLTAAALS
jgi:hypothetical protein